MAKNPSEQLFEKYLGEHGYTGWEFEPSLPGKTKKPDYLVRCNEGTYLFEVKQRSAMHWNSPDGPQCCDPSAGIQNMMQQARRKFKEFKKLPCCLVLYNDGDWSTWLRPIYVFEAMLGRLTLAMPFDGTRAYPETARTIFNKGGTMVRDKTGDYQNTTISAIMVIESKNLAQFVSTAPALSTNQVVRVVVHENPGARIPFTRELFAGPYDERWAYLESGDMESQDLTQVAVGVRVCEILDLNEKKADDDSDDDEYI